MPVLSRKGVLDYGHFLHGAVGDSAFLGLLVTLGVAKRGAIKPVFGGHGLAAINPRLELASAEDGVAVGSHRNISRLHLEQSFRQADVGAHHSGQVFVVLLSQSVGDLRILAI